MNIKKTATSLESRGTGLTANAHASDGQQSVRAFLQVQLKLRWQKYRKAVKRSRKKFSENSVHELRIETRRMLALLELMHPFCPARCLVKVEQRYKKLFKSSALLRDTQVQSGLLKKELKRFSDLASFRKWLRRREKRLARRFKASVSCGVKPKLKSSVRGLRNWCRGWGKEPDSRNYENKVIHEHLHSSYERLVRLRKAVQPDKPATIHSVRIAFKAYRYMVEMLHPDLLKVPVQYLKQLQSYQSITGDIQDAEVLLHTLAEFHKEHAKSDVAAFRAEITRRYAKLRQRFLSTPLPSGSVAFQNGLRHLKP